MFDASPENSERFLYIFSAVHGLFTPFREAIKTFKSLYPKGTPITLKNFLPRVRDFFLIFGWSILLLVVSLVILVFLSTSKKPSNSSNTDVPAISVCTAPVTSWPIKRSVKDRWLDEMDSKVSNSGVLFIKQWDTFDDVKIKHKVYPHSIGVRIPTKYQSKYQSIIASKQLTHTEYIEYPLGFEYATLQFDFGIDDLSFPVGVFDDPNCQFKIIVDKCDSASFYSSKQDHLYETDWLNERCCLHRTPEMDVSGFETVRITVVWQFFPRSNGPVAYNIAIVNPILRAAKIHQ